jgi:uncharacterized membrane protein (UPF0127 family)
MKCQLASLAFLSTAILIAGCDPQSPRSSGMPPAGSTANQANGSPAPSAALGYAQPRLQTLKIYLGPKELTAEVALTDQERMTGMMFRTNIAENEGMFFVFPIPHKTGFWMKNVTVPLSVAYIDPEGTILEIHKLVPGNTNPVEATSSRIQFVLETAQGWFERNGVSTGAVIRTDRGSLAETFTWNRR